MNKCSDFEELISLCIDDMLKPTEIESLLEHLEQCTQCTEYYNDIKAIKQKFTDKEIQYPENLTLSILEHIKNNKETETIFYNYKKFKPLYTTLVACACLALVVSTIFVTTPPKKLVDVPMTTNEVEPLQSAPQERFLSHMPESEEKAINPVEAEILSESYAFAFEFEGSGDLDGIEDVQVLFSNDEITYITVDNKISLIEQVTTKLNKLHYIEITTNLTQIDTDNNASKAIIIIHKKN